MRPMGVILALAIVSASDPVRAEDGCFGETRIDVVAWNAASRELLVRSTTRSNQLGEATADGDLHSAEVAAIGIAPPFKVRSLFKMEYDPKLYGAALEARVAEVISRQQGRGFRPLEAREVPREGEVHTAPGLEEARFSDPLGKGEFVVRKKIGDATGRGSTFTLLHRGLDGSEQVLAKNFVSRHQANVYAVPLPERLIFWDSYLTVASRWCNKPVVSTYRLTVSRVKP